MALNALAVVAVGCERHASSDLRVSSAVVAIGLRTSGPPALRGVSRVSSLTIAIELRLHARQDVRRQGTS
eukprot:7517088-Alexandrium_andersonii.AAC.1